MAYELPNGEPFRGYLSNGDITTAIAVPLFDRNGTARTLAVGERPVITDILVSAGATAFVLTLFQDTSKNGSLDSGEELVSVSAGVNTTVAHRFETPLMGRVAAHVDQKLFALASAASVNGRVTLVGIILKS